MWIKYVISNQLSRDTFDNIVKKKKTQNNGILRIDRKFDLFRDLCLFKVD